MKRLPWTNIYFLIVLTLLGVIGMQYCIGLRAGSLNYTNSIWTFLLWVVLLYHLRKMVMGDMWEKIAPLLNPCFIFGLCFAGAMSAGTQLDAVGVIDFADGWSYGSVLVVAVMLTPFSGGVLVRLSEFGRRNEINCRVSGRKRTLLLTWAVLFLAYIPTFLASFPGFFTYDAEWTLYVVTTEKYSAHMPVVYVMLLGWFIRSIFRITHSYNVGIAIYILGQMCVLSAYPNTYPDGYRGKYTGDVLYEDSSYFAFSTENPGERRHLLPVLERFYEKISLEIYQQKVPVISMLFSIGFWCWVYIFAALYLFVRGCRRQIFALMPMGIMFLIALLGPIVLVRYVLYLFFGVPLVLALLLDADTMTARKESFFDYGSFTVS